MAPSINIPISLQSSTQRLPHLASPLGLTYLAALTLTLFLTYTLLSALYNIFFHPLSHIPGPKLWSAFPVLRLLSGLRGDTDARIVRLHARHGPAVRVSTREVSFATAQAWNDIYGYRTIPQLPKPFRREPGKVPSIINAGDKDHTRFRKALSHGFSERALKEQEALVRSYVDLLVEKLYAVAKDGGQGTDMVKWFNWTTFDIIGDLSFGQSFDCLNSTAYHHWVTNVLNLLESVPLVRGMMEYPLTFKFLAFFLFPKKVRDSRGYQEKLVKERIETRINNESQKGRYDFMDSMMRHQGDKDEMTFWEMVMTANTLVLAGSETTASLLSGVTFYLCQNPRVYEKVKEEIRGKFKSEDDITFASVMECEYMLAVLEEGLRMYPPAPSLFQRETLSEMEVDGVRVSKGTHVGVHQLAAYRWEGNWRRGPEFVPERWLKDGREGEFRDDNRAVLQPFAVGPRNCLGRNLALAEMRLILANLLWNFDFELCPESEGWIDQKIKVLWLKPKLMCKVKVRDGLEKSE